MHMRKHQRRFVHREKNYVAKLQAQLESLKRLATITFYVIFVLCSVGYWFYHRRSKILAGVSNEKIVGHTYTLLETSENNNDADRGANGQLYGLDGIEISQSGIEQQSGTSESKIEFDLNREMRFKFKYLN